MDKNRYILTLLVENEPGVTARVAGLFAGRGYNIETICGAPTANPKMSRITITTKANPLQLEQCKKQIKRLVNVIKLRDMTGEEAVKREMALVCVKVTPETRENLNQIIAAHGGRIMNAGRHDTIFEVTGNENTIDDLLSQLGPFGIKKLARSGVLALYKDSEQH